MKSIIYAVCLAAASLGAHYGVTNTDAQQDSGIHKIIADRNAILAEL